MTTATIWGIGGFDPQHPNGNVVAKTVDNGDGTGTRTDYTTDPPAVTQLSGLPIPPPPPPPTAEERLASLVAALADAQSLEEIRTAAAGIV